LSRQIGRVAGIVFAELVACQQWIEIGELGRVLEHAPEAARLAAEIHHPQWMCGMQSVLGWAAYVLLDHAAAIQALTVGLAQAHQLGSAMWGAFNAAYLAFSYTEHGEFAQAEAAIRAGYAPEQPPLNLGERLLALAWGRLLLARGESAAALAVADDLLATLPGRPAYRSQPIPLLLLLRGQALTALARAAEADHVLNEALHGARLRGSRTILWEIHRARGRLQAQLGQPDEAAQEFAAAREVIDSIADGIHDVSERERFRAAARLHLETVF